MTTPRPSSAAASAIRVFPEPVGAVTTTDAPRSPARMASVWKRSGSNGSPSRNRRAGSPSVWRSLPQDPADGEDRSLVEHVCRNGQEHQRQGIARQCDHDGEGHDDKNRPSSTLPKSSAGHGTYGRCSKDEDGNSNEKAKARTNRIANLR